MSILTDLQEARELILKKDHWTINAFARNPYGYTCLENDDDACSWCATGALLKVSGGDYDRYVRARRVLGDASRDLFSTGPLDVNDELGHEATIKMYDYAIDLVKGQA